MLTSRSLIHVLWLAAGLALAPPPPVATADDEVTTRTRHFSDSSTDRTPATTAFPSYPRIARRDRIEGEATVCFRIDKLGRIRSARVRDASHRIFERPALRAIRESSFEPLQPDEILATGRTCRTYRFRLEPVLADSQSG
ncbi:MAG: TonB family protein [Woeseiaceae bacterium]|nr:TonB family protein [Woeseiaceae bacterium]